MFVSLTKPPTHKQSREAHDVQVLQCVAQCILLDNVELILVSVWNVGLLLVQSTDGIRLVGAHVVVTHFMHHRSAGVTDTLNDTTCCVIEAGLANVCIYPVDVFQLSENISECTDIDEALPDNLVGLRFGVDNDEQL